MAPASWAEIPPTQMTSGDRWRQVQHNQRDRSKCDRGRVRLKQHGGDHGPVQCIAGTRRLDHAQLHGRWLHRLVPYRAKPSSTRCVDSRLARHSMRAPRPVRERRRRSSRSTTALLDLNSDRHYDGVGPEHSDGFGGRLGYEELADGNPPRACIRPTSWGTGCLTGWWSLHQSPRNSAISKSAPASWRLTR